MLIRASSETSTTKLCWVSDRVISYETHEIEPVDMKGGSVGAEYGVKRGYTDHDPPKKG